MPNLEAAPVGLFDIVFFKFALNKNADDSIRIIKILDIFLFDDAGNYNILKSPDVFLSMRFDVTISMSST